jgi:hypothetical protein
MVFFYSSIQGLQRGIVDLGKDDKVNDLWSHNFLSHCGLDVVKKKKKISHLFFLKVQI